MELIERMNELLPKMSKGQKKITNYILENFDKAVFMTAAKLGNAVQVSESTVVRFATLLGYDGFPKFQKALEELVSTKLSDSSKIEISNANNSKQNVLHNVLTNDIKNINMTLASIDKESFDLALNTIDSSRKIYICGIRSCKILADFLGFYLNMIYDNVKVLDTSNPSELFEQMFRINEKDCFIGISFPRYSMRTLKAMEFANDRNAHVISITDSIHSPMCLYSSCNLTANSDLNVVVDSLAAPLSLINAIISSLYMKRQEKSISSMEELERLWEDYQIYDKDEINMFADNTINIKFKKEK